MSEQTFDQAQKLIRSAYQSLRKNDRAEARRLAEAALELSPGLEDPYLILAALSAPEKAVGYLKKALEINPASQRARKGMQWTAQKLRASQPQETPAAEIEKTAPIIVAATEAAGAAAAPEALPAQEAVEAQPKRLVRPRTFMVCATAVIGVMLLVVLAWAVWPLVRPVFAKNNSAPRPAALVKPTLTPTNTPTHTPTNTPTNPPTPTTTPTAPPTFTSTPTVTSTITETPVPTATRTRAPTKKPATNAGGIPSEVTGTTKWVDVNLSKQRAYAYEWSTLVRTCLVSTGIARYPTVTGQFHVYVKYRSALMTGPGYYLPNVPYTMYFYKSYGLHGTYWHNNFGTPMSHGCVNLRTEDAKWLYENWVVIGTLVNIHY